MEEEVVIVQVSVGDLRLINNTEGEEVFFESLSPLASFRVAAS
ncbi:MAG: hypothetical protein ACRD8Z_08940 [Nitrososphaeraceae archaeon]